MTYVAPFAFVLDLNMCTFHSYCVKCKLDIINNEKGINEKFLRLNAIIYYRIMCTWFQINYLN